MVQWLVASVSSACAMMFQDLKIVKKEQSTSGNHSVIKKPAQEARQHGTMATASPPWHNSGSIEAARAVKSVMVSQ